MRRWLLWLVVWLGCSSVSAQSAASYARQGQQFYNAARYAQARVWFAEAVAIDSTDMRSTLMWAQSLRQLHRDQDALPLYKKVHRHAGKKFPVATLYYALSLKHQQRCPEALILLEQFVSYAVHDSLMQRARVAQTTCQQQLINPEDTIQLSLRWLPSPVNTGSQDYAAVPYPHDTSLLLTTSRGKRRGHRIDYRYGEPFTDLLMAAQGRRGSWTRRKRKPRVWNTEEQEGPGCFSPDTSRFYFTRCDEKRCRIYVSERQRGKWRQAVALPATVNALGGKHPALSAGGDTLYFASQRAGGHGGSDLWMKCPATVATDGRSPLT